MLVASGIHLPRQLVALATARSVPAATSPPAWRNTVIAPSWVFRQILQVHEGTCAFPRQAELRLVNDSLHALRATYVADLGNSATILAAEPMGPRTAARSLFPSSPEIEALQHAEAAQNNRRSGHAVRRRKSRERNNASPPVPSRAHARIADNLRWTVNYEEITGVVARGSISALNRSAH